MIEWLDEFYNDPDLRASMLREYLPLFSNYVNEAVGPVAAPFVQALAESYVDRYLGSSRSQLQELVTDSADPLTDLATRFDEWEQKRPEKVAKNELVRSANAAQVDQFRQAGVEKMVWRASGGACPFCREIDGVVISVNGTFFSEGDELAPEGVEHPIHFESSIGHPPVHQGCTCFVEASTEIDTDNTSPEVQAQIESIRAQTSGLQHEQGFVIDPRTGERIWEADGFAAEVPVPSDLDLEGKILVHNHPLQRGQKDGEAFSLSGGDFQMFRARRVAELRAETSHGSYVLSQPDGWPENVGYTARDVLDRHEAIMEEVLFGPVWEQEFARSSNQGLAYAIDETNRRTAAEFGYRYTFIPKPAGENLTWAVQEKINL